MWLPDEVLKTTDGDTSEFSQDTITPTYCMVLSKENPIEHFLYLMLPLFSISQEACLIAKEQRTGRYQRKSHTESTGKIEHIAKKGADGKKGESHDYRYDIHKPQRLGRSNAALEIFGCSNRQAPNENIK